MAQSVGIKDVARAAGVSVGTVSNVINRPDSVASETRARVLSAIDRLGYVRSESARQLRAGRSRIMGLLVLDMGNPFFVDVARGAERAARKAGLGVMVCNSAQSAARGGRLPVALRRTAGARSTAHPGRRTGRNIESFRRHGIPFVLVDRVAEGTTECSVSVDDVAGGALAVRHLVDAGHRSHRVRQRAARPQPGRDRRAGALNALAEAGLGPDALRELPTERLDVAAGRDAGARLLGLADRPDRRVLRQRPARARRPAGHVRGRCRRPRRPRDRRLRRHRVRRRRRRPAHLGPPARRHHGRPGRRTAAGGDRGASGPDAHEHRRVVLQPELVVRRSSLAAALTGDSVRWGDPGTRTAAPHVLKNRHPDSRKCACSSQWAAGLLMVAL